MWVSIHTCTVQVDLTQVHTHTQGLHHYRPSFVSYRAFEAYMYH